MNSSASSHPQESVSSPVRSSPVTHTAINFEDAFWAPRLQTIREHTLSFIFEQMKKDGHFDAFKSLWKAGMHPNYAWGHREPGEMRVYVFK